jgi:hypothetical protein
MHTDPHKPAQLDPEHPGYELTDVNVRGIVVFLSGLIGFLVVFFVVCFVLGKAINHGIVVQDGAVTKWNQHATMDGSTATGAQRENLMSNTEMQQRASQQVAETFPAPRLEADDGLNDVYEMHSREDLLLNYYSSIDGQAGAVRIPIDRAMDLIAQRGLPVAGAAPAAKSGAGAIVAATAAPAAMTGDVQAVVQAPLTSGFARTGYEQEALESRAQKLEFSKAEGSEK